MGFVASAAADSRVTVYFPGQSRPAVITGASHLEQVALNPVLAGHTWWPGTIIAEKMATAVEQERQRQLLARLSTLSGELRRDNDLDLAASVDRVRGQLSAIKVTGRQFVSMDPDVIRLEPGADYALSGDYTVYALAKPSSVRLFGVLTGTGSEPYQVGKDVSDYLVGHERLSGADKSVAWLITPDGRARSVPVAYWNRRHNEALPGSVIYVGFSSWSLPGDYRDVNDQIVTLLTHRIPD
ncbi:capsule biosynthesis GfcC family protein [Martelella alba]|uniref:capsule biosynthesis GfcC family protein n=1 Tax=Martelella alba TaxID=2590451 RepID=UPI001E347F83|nr:capsule biosynthesis GfcC family protein [Martelella alba]